MPSHGGRPDRSAISIAGILRQAAPYFSAAWVLTVGLLAGLFGGRWLDGKLESAPLFLLLGLLLGAGIGLWEVARVTLRMGRRGDEDERGEGR